LAKADAMTGHTEAEGYAASLRQLAQWIRDGLPADPDELDAAADFIDRQARLSRVDEALAGRLSHAMTENIKLEAEIAELRNRRKAIESMAAEAQRLKLP
jgi:DNA repair ATPase RecN